MAQQLVASGNGLDRAIERDQRTLLKFVEVYCADRHPEAPRRPVDLRAIDVDRLARGRPVLLCNDCCKLLAHALVKRQVCPMQPKPACKHCPNHCYHPAYRAQIREAMKHSGRKLVLHGRLDYLFHLLF